MKSITRIFLRGLFTVLPISLCVYMLYLFFIWAETLSYGILKWIFGDVSFHYVTGMGVILTLALIFLLGLLMSTPIMQMLFFAVELPFKNVPILKSIYTAIKDLTDYFSPKTKKKTNVVVAVKHPKHPIELVGFLTRDNLNNLPKGLSKQGKVAVYLPLSYQIGGYTVFIPKEWITKLDISVEDAMKLSLTAWMPSGDKAK